MTKTNAAYILVAVTVAVAIFLGVAATSNSSSNSHSHAVQQNGQCCSGETAHVENKEKAWNEVCPVMGGKVQETSATVEHNEKHYGFCCPGCIDQFADNPETFAVNLSDDGKRFLN